MITISILDIGFSVGSVLVLIHNSRRDPETTPRGDSETDVTPDAIYVGYRKLTSSRNTDQSLATVDKMLDEIAREALE